MKVLIITYYWPPAGGSGVQRWLKFVKYLQDFNITPIVYTPDTIDFPKLDESLLKEIPDNVEVLKQPIWNPINLFFWKKNKKQQGVSSATNNKFLSFIRGNFFVPDAKVFWVKPSVNFLCKYIKENDVEVIISTGPPHSMHLIAQKIKQKIPVKWIADFRDPWTNIYYNKEFSQTLFAKKRNLKLEKSVLSSADYIVTVSNSLKRTFLETAKNVAVITNGYDDEVLENEAVQVSKKFTISYIGLLPKQSNPTILFKVLKHISDENDTFKKDLQIQFIGDIANEVKEEINVNNLTENTQFVDYVSHDKAVKFQKESQVLLLLIPNVPNNKGILTGKLFEYLTSKRPILAIGPEESDLSEILKNTNAGIVVDFNNEQKLTTAILRLYKSYKNGSLQSETINIDKFHRRELTKQLAKIIKQI
ncbi:glycosyltransferase family 4 protein [Polaribacter tangerinus]|uniref:glycosyltransferase family 4 protein n=1 Tax=Polaribacter tangerinus TaxID=1920034 RepID=UPI000B4B4330|nr:glycosyltransferase family 4 protein [Polaribacter tangerinus]